jgi:hypothetical protein
MNIVTGIFCFPGLDQVLSRSKFNELQTYEACEGFSCFTVTTPLDPKRKWFFQARLIIY